MPAAERCDNNLWAKVKGTADNRYISIVSIHQLEMIQRLWVAKEPCKKDIKDGLIINILSKDAVLPEGPHILPIYSQFNH